MEVRSAAAWPRPGLQTHLKRSKYTKSLLLLTKVFYIGFESCNDAHCEGLPSFAYRLFGYVGEKSFDLITVGLEHWQIQVVGACIRRPRPMGVLFTPRLVTVLWNINIHKVSVFRHVVFVRSESMSLLADRW